MLNQFKICDSVPLKKAETKKLAGLMKKLRGYYLGVLGTHRKLSDLPSHCLHAFALSPDVFLENHFHYIQTHYETLPMRDNNIDAIFIPYLMTYLENPLAVLEEIHRILIAEGKLLITGFELLHPWCWWNAPKYSHLTLFQLKKLLKENGFLIENIHHFYYGALYFIEAKKQVIPITAIKPAWHKERVEKALARPATRKAS